jgi:hypothetical protein
MSMVGLPAGDPIKSTHLPEERRNNLSADRFIEQSHCGMSNFHLPSESCGGFFVTGTGPLNAG